MNSMEKVHCAYKSHQHTLVTNQPSRHFLLLLMFTSHYCVPLSMHEIFHSKRFHSLNYFPSIRAIYSSIKPPTNKNRRIIIDVPQILTIIN